MKKYKLSSRYELHIYVVKHTPLEDGSDEKNNSLLYQTNTTESLLAEADVTGQYVREVYDSEAKALIKFIKPHMCRLSLSTLFEALGNELKNDLEKLVNPTNPSNKEFNEQYALISKFLESFKKV
jgi:DNA polymerase sigma